MSASGELTNLLYLAASYYTHGQYRSAVAFRANLRRIIVIVNRKARIKFYSVVVR